MSRSTHRVAAIGDRLDHGRYVIEDVIAQGGQGILFKATDCSGTTVAVKQLISDPSDQHHALQRARFIRAAELRTTHPRAVDAVDRFDDNGLYAVFPWIEGSDLSRVSGRLDWPHAVQLCLDAASILQGVHCDGVIHRDVKPANLVLDHAGRVHLIDFGIAHRVGRDTLTPKGCVVGSLLTASPEQIAGERIDGTCDVFALGMVLIELLIGRPARLGSDDESLKHEAVHAPPPRPSEYRGDLPSGLDAICAKATALDPAARYRSAEEFGTALQGVLAAHGGHSASRPTPVVRCLACGARQTEPNPRVCVGCGRPFAANPTRLVSALPGIKTSEYIAPLGAYLVGRDQIAPGDPEVSRSQLAVSCAQQQVRLRCTGKNPTRIDGVAIGPDTAIRDGQRMSFAGHEFRVHA